MSPAAASSPMPRRLPASLLKAQSNRIEEEVARIGIVVDALAAVLLSERGDQSMSNEIGVTK